MVELVLVIRYQQVDKDESADLLYWATMRGLTASTVSIALFGGGLVLPALV